MPTTNRRNYFPLLEKEPVLENKKLVFLFEGVVVSFAGVYAVLTVVGGGAG